MNKRLYLPVMIGLLMLGFFSLNLVAALVFSGWRLDLTEHQLYRLSPGSRAVISRIEEPVHWTFYYSRTQAADFPAIRAYASRVREFLAGYDAEAGGQIELVEIDPTPFSPDEDAALNAGLVPMPTPDGGQIFFGLVAANAVDQQALIPLFSETTEYRLEYDLTRLISDIERAEQARLAVVTTLPITPEDGAPNRFVAELAANYEIDFLGRDFSDIGPADALLLIHPPQLSEEQLYLIDQFVLERGRVLAFLDPMSHIALKAGPDGLPPIDTRRDSHLGPLLAHWGLSWDANTVAMDRSLALTVGVVGEDGRTRNLPYPLWFSVGPSEMPSGDLATTGLERGVNFGSPGALTLIEDSPLTLTPLIQTTEDGTLTEADIAASAPSPEDLQREYTPSGDPILLAGRLTGRLTTAFPEGPPAGEGLFNPDEHLSETERPVDLVIIGDTDWLDDIYYLRTDPTVGETQLSDNLVFALNLIDMAAGDPDLIALRSRVPSIRPMRRVEILREAAEQAYLTRQSELEDRIAEAEDRLARLQASGQSTGLSASISLAERDDALAQRRLIAEGQAELRDIERSFRSDIDALEQGLQFWTIGLPPALVILVGIAGSLVRRRRSAS